QAEDVVARTVAEQDLVLLGDRQTVRQTPVDQRRELREVGEHLASRVDPVSDRAHRYVLALVGDVRLRLLCAFTHHVRVVREDVLANPLDEIRGSRALVEQRADGERTQRFLDDARQAVAPDTRAAGVRQRRDGLEMERIRVPLSAALDELLQLVRLDEHLARALLLTLARVALLHVVGELLLEVVDAPVELLILLGHLGHRVLQAFADLLTRLNLLLNQLQDRLAFLRLLADRLLDRRDQGLLLFFVHDSNSCSVIGAFADVDLMLEIISSSTSLPMPLLWLSASRRSPA